MNHGSIVRAPFASLLLSLLAFSAHAADWNGRVYDVARGSYLQEAEIRAALRQADVLVLGEKHDTPTVQAQQARAVALALEARPEEAGRWLLGWEFLERRHQSAVTSLFSRFSSALISGIELMDGLMGAGRNRSYLPILEVAAKYHARLRALNLGRDEKAPILKGGLAALDPSLIPPGFAMGGVNYRARFFEVMGGGHAGAEKLERYFEAQCLTDDVMAHELLAEQAAFRVIVNGSFHSDYGDGVVARIRDRAPSMKILQVRLIDAADYSEADLEPALNLADPLQSPRDGQLADWIWFAGEPARQ